MGVLKQLNQQNYSNISKRVLEAREELVCVQARLFTSPVDEDLCTQEKLLVQKYIELRNAEESFIKQRSRVKWLALGDWGPQHEIFSPEAMHSQSQDSIVSFQNDAGVILEDPGEVKSDILAHYQVCWVPLLLTK